MTQPIILSAPLLRDFYSKNNLVEVIYLFQRKSGHRGNLVTKPHPTVPGMFMAVAKGLAVMGHNGDPSTGVVLRDLSGIGENPEQGELNLYKRLFANPRQNLTFWETKRYSHASIVSLLGPSVDERVPVIVREDIAEDLHVHPYYGEVGVLPNI